MYELAGISEGDLMEPLLSKWGLRPVGTCSACWRGYQAVYGIVDGQLVLDTLHVNLLADETSGKRLKGPEINGVAPLGPRHGHDWLNNHYQGIRYPLEYTGGLLIADGFIEELYVHMGFHPAWKYTEVVELVFEKGVLQKEFDRSERMAEVRCQMVKAGAAREYGETPYHGDIVKFIASSFDRRY